MPLGIAILLALYGCNDRISSEHQSVSQSAAKNSASTVTDDLEPDKDIRRSRQKEVSVTIPVDPASALAVANVCQVELIISHKTFETDQETGAVRLTFEDLDLLKIFNSEPDSEDLASCLPGWMTSLDGQLVRINGVMGSTFEEAGLTEFVLEKNKGQVYGYRPIKYDECLLVKLIQGTTTDLVSQFRSLDIVGRFKIDLQLDNGLVMLLYVIQDAKVIVR